MAAAVDRNHFACSSAGAGAGLADGAAGLQGCSDAAAEAGCLQELLGTL